MQFRKIDILDDMNHTFNENWAYLIYNLRPNKFWTNWNLKFGFRILPIKWYEPYILLQAQQVPDRFEIRFSFLYQITKWYELYILTKSELTSSIITGPTGSGPICASASGFAIGEEKVWLTAKARVANATKAFKIR